MNLAQAWQLWKEDPSEESLNALVDAISKTALAFLCKTYPGSAFLEDAVAAARARMYEWIRANRIQTAEQLRRYLFLAVIQCHTECFRKQAAAESRLTMYQREVAGYTPGPDEGEHLDTEGVGIALGELREYDAQILVQHYVQGKTFASMAKEHGCDSHTMSAHVAEALQSLIRAWNRRFHPKAV